MRVPFALAILLVLPSAAPAQDVRAIEQAETILYLLKLNDRESGGFKPDAKGKPGLRATSAAVRALKYSGTVLKPGNPMHDKAAEFVMSCHDPKTGGFADTPGGKPDVALTSVGVMAAVELGIPREKFAKAMDYLKEHAKTFEEVRIGAAAVEAWGVKDCPFPLNDWVKVADIEVKKLAANTYPSEIPRLLGSAGAFYLRLGKPLPGFGRDQWVDLLTSGQGPDGGFGRGDKMGSDLETAYRVMRTLYLLKEKPKDARKLREFVAKCRNKDGGYGVKPGDPSTVGATYYASIITHWLDELEKK